MTDSAKAPETSTPDESEQRRMLGARIALRILRASQIMERDATLISQGLGITNPQWFLLNLLQSEGGTTSMTRIAEYSMVTRQNVAAMVSRLMAMEVVTTERDPKDRRSALVTLTPKGERMLLDAKALRDRWADQIFARTSVEDMARADAFLRSLYREVAARAQRELDAVDEEP